MLISNGEDDATRGRNTELTSQKMDTAKVKCHKRKHTGAGQVKTRFSDEKDAIKFLCGQQSDV